MQEYIEQESRALKEVRCNCCGRKLKVEKGILKEGCVHLEAPFGFFTKRDGQVHYFDLCEACYDKITAGFQIPVIVEERTELL